MIAHPTSTVTYCRKGQWTWPRL